MSSTTASADLKMPRTSGKFDTVAVIAEWVGAAAGGLGALMLAINVSWSAYGWLLFLASNVSWIVYAIQRRVRSVLLMQLVFTSTSLTGVYRWLA